MCTGDIAPQSWLFKRTNIDYFRNCKFLLVHNIIKEFSTYKETEFQLLSFFY